MQTVLKHTLGFLGIPARMLVVWLAFLAVLWGSHGAGRGYPAFVVAVLCAGVFWWRGARQGSRRRAILLGAALVLALLPLVYVLVPLTSSALGGLPADLEV